MIARDTFSLETERMTLRPPRLEDADAIQILADDFEIARWMSTFPHPYPVGGALTYLSNRQAKWDDKSDMALALIKKGIRRIHGNLGNAAQRGRLLGSWLLDWPALLGSRICYRGYKGSPCLGFCNIRDGRNPRAAFCGQRSLGPRVEEMWLYLHR